MILPSHRNSFWSPRAHWPRKKARICVSPRREVVPLWCRKDSASQLVVSKQKGGAGRGSGQSPGKRFKPVCTIGPKGHVNSSDWLGRCGDIMLTILLSTVYVWLPVCVCIKAYFSVVGNSLWKSFLWKLKSYSFFLYQNENVERESRKCCPVAQKGFQSFIGFL